LIAGTPSPKLDITSAETPESQSAPAFAREAENTESSPEQPTGAVPVVNLSATQDIAAPDAAAELHLPDSSGPYKMPDLAAEPPKVETAEAVPISEFSAPEVFDEETFRNSQRGETPMIRNWKMLGLQTVLAAALAAAPSSSYALDDQNQGKEGKPGKNSDTKEPSLKELKESLDTIKKDLDSLRAEVLNANLATSGEIKKLKDQIAQLQKDVDTLRGRSTSLYGPRPAGTGHIRLENTYPREITVILNQTSYPLAPGQTMTVSVPAGPFTYQVVNIPGFPVRNRDVLPNETFSITVFPQ
jgi:ribosomal protein L29